MSTSSSHILLQAPLCHSSSPKSPVNPFDSIIPWLRMPCACHSPAACSVPQPKLSRSFGLVEDDLEHPFRHLYWPHDQIWQTMRLSDIKMKMLLAGHWSCAHVMDINIHSSRKHSNKINKQDTPYQVCRRLSGDQRATNFPIEWLLGFFERLPLLPLSSNPHPLETRPHHPRKSFATRCSGRLSTSQCQDSCWRRWS